MKKKTIFKIGASLAGIILILIIAGVVYYNTTVAPVVKIAKNGHPAIVNDKTLEMHYCKNEVEETAVVSKIAMDKFGASSDEYTNAMVRMALASKEKIDSDTINTWSVVFSLYTTLESIVPGYYVVYVKDSEAISILYVQHDKQLAKLYGQSLKAADLQKCWNQEFSLK